MNVLKTSIIVALFACCIANAADEEKSGLFNTFYLEGARGDYILVMRENKTFDLYGPEGKHVNGTVRASSEHVTLIAGDVKRYFHFDINEHNLKLGRRDTDKLTKGDLLGTMPPTTDTRETWVTEAHWVRKGHKVFKAPEGNPPPVVEPPPAVRPVAPVQPAPAADYGDIAGTYSVTSDGLTDTIAITADGHFSYSPPGGGKVVGSLQRTDNDLDVIGEKHTRRFSIKRTPDGLEITRREADVLKAGDSVGTMPPTDRKPLLFKKQGRTALDTEEPRKVAGTQPAPQPAAVAVSTQPAPAVAPAEPKTAAIPVRELKSVVGTFVHKANPFISETLTITDEGVFNYKDSNGAAAVGKAAFDNDLLVLTSGEVVRRFKASLDDKLLILHCDATDKPTFKNDLASMSPTVLKAAKYERK